MSPTKSQAHIDRTTPIGKAHLGDGTQVPDEHVLRDIDDESVMIKKTKTVVLGAYVLLIILGITTGFILSGKGNHDISSVGQNLSSSGGKQAGISDTSTFKDSAVGVLQKGGLDGEGTHQLVRDGGPSQTAYLVSSVVDLDQFVGKKVKVWGQTLAAKKAAWLLDVGKIEAQ